MDNLEKLFRKIPKHNRIRIQEVLEQMYLRNFSNLHPQKLKGYEHIFRIRIGNYRIIYFDDGTELILKAVKKRDESTYSNF